MIDANQNDPNAASPAGADSGGHIPVSTFEVVPYGQTADDRELFSFREAIPPPVEKTTPKKKPQPPVAKVLIAVVFSGAVAILAFTLYSVLGPKPTVSYIDLGSRRFDPDGLSGRLIARWETSGSYQLYLDPIGPAHTASFAAMATDPARQLSITIRLLDAKGLVACQKQILFPAPVARTQDDTDAAPPQEPQQSQTGDMAENMMGENGQIAEIDLRGPLPCPAKAYAKFKAWDFTADFPTPGEEEEWQQQERSTDAKTHGNRNRGVRIARLSAPIEGDDVIIADNPSHGTVATSGGRVFFLGAGLRNRTAEWQVFPAAIHFRCDKYGACALTRANSQVTLQARIVK